MTRTKPAYNRFMMSLILTVMAMSAMNAFGEEQIGNLVFKYMQDINQNHQSFVKQMATIQENGKRISKEKNEFKTQYMNAKNPLDKRDYHASYSERVGTELRNLFDEAVLTNQSARDQLKILNELADSINEGQTTLTTTTALDIIDVSQNLLSSGGELLDSLAEYRNAITDPVINQKLNGAHKTAQFLQGYLASSRKDVSGRNASREYLKNKVFEMIEALNSLYVRSDILQDMIRNQAQFLKTVTEVASIELSIDYAREGFKNVSDYVDTQTNGMKARIDEIDNDMTNLTTGFHRADYGRMNDAVVNQDWAKGLN